jgi:3-dehydroquinate synthase
MPSDALSDALSVRVGLGDRSYDIVVGSGLLTTSSNALGKAVNAKRCAIVTDANVAALHLKPFQALLAKQGVSAEAIILPAGEETKSFSQLESLCGKLLDLKLTRRDVVIALGGGVIGDLTGFAASIVRRGIDFIQVPTTLLAQVDSSVGGKTAINAPQGKNLIGAFYQPTLVLADTDVLQTLPPREVMAGFAEVIKYGLINDRPFFEWLQANGAQVLAREPAALSHAIAASCQNKADVVAADERETGSRALLNLGHTFGHAIEAHAQFDGRILHGEAVSIGMVMAHQVSHALGLMPRADLEAVLDTFSALAMPMTVAGFGLSQLGADEMVHHMGQDKKNVDSRVTLILSKGIGQSFLTRDVSAQDLQNMLTRILQMEKASAL